jgi:hypothetical protein
MILGFLRRPKNQEISLESLSRLWVGDQEDDFLSPSHQDREIFWKNQDITDFYEAYVKPHARVLGQRGLSVLEEILSILDIQGDCPSVVSGEQVGDEALSSSYELLARVNLRTHSLNAAREAFRMIKESYPDHEMVLGKTLIAALGHDLGKIPSSGKYLTGDHPIRSAHVLESIVKDLPYGNEVVKAVRNHHLKSNDSFTTLIKEADHRARDKELREVEFRLSQKKAEENENNEKEPNQLDQRNRPDQPEKEPGNIPEKIDLPWIDPDEMVKLIKPYVNAYVTRKGDLSQSETGYWMAFSFKDGLVYVMPKLLTQIAGRIALDKKERGFVLRCREDEFKRNVEFTIVEKLREKGYIADTIGEGYVGSRYHIYFREEKKPLYGYYTPFKAETFGDFVKLEEMRKGRGRLADIERVERVIKSSRD